MTRRQLISRRHIRAALAFLLLALGVAGPPAGAAQDVDRRKLLDEIRAQLDLAAWKEAGQLIDRAEKRILEESRPLRQDNRHLAELALYLAVTEANRGDRDAAEWYWYAAFNLHQPTAYRDVSEWGKAAEVFGAIELRDLGRDPKGIKTFRPYPGRDFKDPKMPQLRIPSSLTSSHATDDVKAFLVEVFLDERGRPNSPRLMGRLQIPILCYSFLEQMFESKWKPARSEGEPVPMLVEVTQTIKEARW